MYTVFGPTCSGVSTGTSAYTISYTGVPAGFVVHPAPLSITASSATMAYTGPVPAITASFNRFVNGNTQSSLGGAFACSTTATRSSPVGNYPSMCTGAVDANYTITHVDGTVTVVAALAPSITTNNFDSATMGYPFSFQVTTTGYPYPTFSYSGPLP